MLTRRDALRLAALAAAGTAAPFAVTPEEAAALLDGPAAFDPGAGRPTIHTGDPLSPTSFADAVDGADLGGLYEWFGHNAAEEVTAYKQALDRLLDLHPALRDERGFGCPVSRLDEAAMGMWVMSWMAGVRAGAAYEHLRLALMEPLSVCRCNGHGHLRGAGAGGWGTGELCPDCQGKGTVPTPASNLESFFAAD